nr:diguanylate cyclase [uncultured Halomonas sp.]
MTRAFMVDSAYGIRRNWPLSLASLVVGSALLLLLGVMHRLSGWVIVPGLSLLGVSACVIWRYRIGPHDAVESPSQDESERRFRSLLESLPKVAVQGYDSQRRVIYWNEASEMLYGYSADEAIGCYLEDLLIPDSLRESVISAHHDWIEKGLGIPAGELELKHKSGAPVTVFSYHLMLGERTDDPLMFCVDIDLHELTQARREFEIVTGFDTLSHLPDRPAFEAELANRIADSRRQGGRLAVIAIGIEPLGEAPMRDAAVACTQQDALMAMIANRLRCNHPDNPMARFTHAGFVMVLPELQADGDVLPRLEAIFENLHQPFTLGEREHRIATSIGIGLCPENGTSAGELIHTADMAMQRARLAGPNSYWFFDRQLHDELTRQYRLMQRLWHDLHDGEYVLRYQPRMAASDERIEGLEARLHFSARKGAPSTDAIPVAERSDLVHRLGDWVMREACRQQSQCQVTAPQDCRIDIAYTDGRITPNTVLEPLEAYMNDSRTRAQPDRHPAERESIERNGQEYAIRLEVSHAPSHRDQP